jgi:hypothetical protein
MTSWPDDVTRQLAHCLQFTSGLLDAMDEAVRGDSENIWRYTDVCIDFVHNPRSGGSGLQELHFNSELQRREYEVWYHLFTRYLDTANLSVPQLREDI